MQRYVMCKAGAYYQLVNPLMIYYLVYLYVRRHFQLKVCDEGIVFGIRARTQCVH